MYLTPFVVRPLGDCRETTVPMGREQIRIGPALVRWAGIQAHPPLGARDRVAGGRTSVSAPLGVCRKTTVPMGREQIWNRFGTPFVRRRFTPGTHPVV